MLTVDQKIKELGTIPFGKAKKFDFTLTNTGNEEIIIAKLLRGCKSCTEATISTQRLHPQDVATVDVTFTPGDTGDTKKEIQVLYTDGKKPGQNLTLTFKAKVK